MIYAHPANPGLRLMVVPQPPNGIVVVSLPNGMPQQYDLGAFQPQVWVQLLSAFGPLPILLNVQPSQGVFAAWN
jgi:hypothetical protein